MSAYFSIKAMIWLQLVYQRIHFERNIIDILFYQLMRVLCVMALIKVNMGKSSWKGDNALMHEKGQQGTFS